MRSSIITFLIMVLLSFHTSAFMQNNEWYILDPHQILSNSIQSVKELPVININDETRTLNYFDPQNLTWTSYSYPNELKEIGSAEYYIRKRSNGTYLISPEGFMEFSPNFVPVRWIFDPANGQFSQAASVCINWVQALTGEGDWVIVDDGAKSHLCNTETEVMSPPIPSRQEDGYCEHYSSQRSAFSPDKIHLLFFCGGLGFSAFSYDIEKRDFLYLGDSTNNRENENVDVIRWVGNNEAIIHSYPSWNPPSNAYYTTDVTSPNSLRLIGSDMYLAPFYFDNPPHLEWMPCEFGACSPDDEVGFHYYDFVTHQMTIWPNLPMIAGESSLIPDGSGDRLYRHLNSTSPNAFFIYKAPSATLIRFNYETQKQKAIFTGEIEWIEGLSSDGRYVALQIGDDNEVASSALLAENQMHYRPHGHAEIEVLDLQTNKFVYKAQGNEWEEFGLHDSMPFMWLNYNTFLIQNVEGQYDQIVQLQPNVQVIAEYPAKSSLPSPNGDLVLVDTGHNRLAVYNVLTKRLIPVIEQSLDQNLQINFKWNDIHSLLLTINHNDIILAQWIVQVA